MHLRLSISILRKSLKADPEGFFADFVAYGCGYAMLTKRAIRENRALVEDVGLDFNILGASSIQFVTELLMIAIDEAGQADRIWTLLSSAANMVGRHPGLVNGVYAASFLPEPPFARRLIYLWGRLDQWRASRSPARTLDAQSVARRGFAAVLRHDAA